MTGLSLVTVILQELGVLAAREVPDANDAAVVLGVINRVLDDWRAEHGAAYVESLDSFTLTPALQPHTIGPSGATWTLAKRPDEVVAANLVIAGLRTPIAVREVAWWMGLSQPGQTGDQPTDLNYRPTWPNGSLYFWPEPSSAYTVEVLTRGVLADLTLAGTFTMPAGYQSAIEKTAIEEVAGTFGRPVTGDMVLRAAKARARVWKTNAPSARISTNDSGIPGAGLGGWYDYQTGTTR